ncbi:TPA: 7,8-dihydro-8-oxoguanine-triphosphatase [Streptococcus pneumoniae]
MELLNSRMYFQGCKIALFCGDKLLTILRDDKDDIPCPNMWELPGGGKSVRENLI